MEFPIEIQKLIKEFSMPKYRSPLHFKAFTSSKQNFYDIVLNQTPYTTLLKRFDGWDYIMDLMRGYNFDYAETNEALWWFYHSEDEYEWDEYEWDDEEQIYQISDEDIELTDIIIIE